MPIRAKYPTNLILLDTITRKILGEQYRLLSSSLCRFLQFPGTSYLLGLNIHLGKVFSNTLNLFLSLNVSHLISPSYKTTGKIILMCILSFIILDSKLEDKRFCTVC
jgi:hypothetical protein